MNKYKKLSKTPAVKNTGRRWHPLYYLIPVVSTYEQEKVSTQYREGKKVDLLFSSLFQKNISYIGAAGKINQLSLFYLVSYFTYLVIFISLNKEYS